MDSIVHVIGKLLLSDQKAYNEVYLEVREAVKSHGSIGWS